MLNWKTISGQSVFDMLSSNQVVVRAISSTGTAAYSATIVQPV